MAQTTNFAENKSVEKWKSEPQCTAELTGEVNHELIFLLVVNISVSITTFLGNTLILVALQKESSLHPPSKLLYRNLAITDLCVGIIAEPVYVTYFMSVLSDKWDICFYANLLSFFTCYVFSTVSLSTLAVISVDRLLALLLGLRYRQVVTLKRTLMTLIVGWILSIVSTLTYLWDPIVTSWCIKVGLPVCLVTSFVCYVKIFFILRHNQIQVLDHFPQRQQNQPVPLNIARYRKAVSAALWVQTTLVVSYLPFLITEALKHQRGMSLSLYLARQFALTLVLLNSSLNPMLYCWKIREVRQAVQDTIRELLCSSPN
ncbi:olfactory receptor 4D10-like [Porites lutea]|uniref:olfactory receptor 4D10-like n=1 Tax=Porites lutea TaxID=51062 RepID=UPI003CC51ABA